MTGVSGAKPLSSTPLASRPCKPEFTSPPPSHLSPPLQFSRLAPIETAKRISITISPQINQNPLWTSFQKSASIRGSLSISQFRFANSHRLTILTPPLAAQLRLIPRQTSSRGGTGRRVRLRTVWGNPWRFKSSREHFPWERQSPRRRRGSVEVGGRASPRLASTPPP